jgi:hypothetical protein
MNIYLEKLFNKYSVSPKNRYEIKQIYDLLPANKKNNLINNFELLMYKIHRIEESLKMEQEILLDRIIPDIYDIIKKDNIEEVRKEIDSLKIVV